MNEKKVVLGLLGLCASVMANAQVFSQDFESGLGGNESTSGLFGINNDGFGNNGTNMMGHAGTGYVDDEYSFYEVTLDLTNWVGTTMSFDYAGRFEQHFDRFNVLASTGAISPPAGLLNPTGASNMQFIDLDDEHHPNLGQFAYDTTEESGGEGGVALFDLSGFDGQVVTLRFQFGSDGSVSSDDEGFNMDSLNVSARPVPEPATMAVLGMGALALLRRRKAQK